MNLFLIFILVCVSNVSADVLPKKEWWETAVIYQIYPRSFKDTNGDGVGDLNGIIENLEYLKDTGVDALWISPFFLSPMYDFGYDITDYRKIQPEYGTMEDLETLLAKAKKFGLRIIMDFVPNHTSNESDWFRFSANRTKGYENYYIWMDGRPDSQNPGKMLPPSNWVSFFRKSAWEYNKQRGQFYLHQFHVAQPDLNYREPAVIEEMKNVLRFWLDKGVNGFRVDIIPVLFEVDPIKFDGQYPDEPKSGDPALGPDDYGFLNHIYTQGQDETYDMVYQWRELMDEYTAKDGEPRILLTESYQDINMVMRYYGNSSVNGAHVPFNFEFIMHLTSKSNARDIKVIIDKWMDKMPRGHISDWVNGNHDQSRAATRYGIDKADGFNMLALLLPGVAVTYQGEELAMTDGFISWEDTVDPEACNTDDPINYYKSSRDPGRTPFHWDDTKNAGFSDGDKTWLPVAANFREINLKKQKEARKSHYKFYKDLTNLRRSIPLTYGDLDVRVISDEVLALSRFWPKHMTVIGVMNLSNNNQSIDLTVFHVLPPKINVYASSLNSTMVKGEVVDTRNIKLSPFDTVVFISG